MKASLDTNVIIHLYRANKQCILFEMFEEGIYVDEFIYNVELENHGKDVKELLQKDIDSGKVTLVTKEWLKEHHVLPTYRQYLDEERLLFFSTDMGESCAIALARTLGAVDLVTDDTKPGGPHHYLMRIPESKVMPFAYYEIIILLYLMGTYSATEAIGIFDEIRAHSPDQSFSFSSRFKFFVNRFMNIVYSKREELWFNRFCESHSVNGKQKLSLLYLAIKRHEQG